ncbi:MAG: hypothetical protein QOH96_2611 [Blastocatellia bacterium]|jgi:hypothetical protein|nr:hypothetical protein [Blastocatellia bacterium]
MKSIDIFWFDENGPIWIEVVDTVEIAKARIEELRKSEKLPQVKSGSYAVIDRRTGQTLYRSSKQLSI